MIRMTLLQLSPLTRQHMLPRKSIPRLILRMPLHKRKPRLNLPRRHLLLHLTPRNRPTHNQILILHPRSKPLPNLLQPPLHLIPRTQILQRHLTTRLILLLPFYLECQFIRMRVFQTLLTHDIVRAVFGLVSFRFVGFVLDGLKVEETYWFWNEILLFSRLF